MARTNGILSSVVGQKNIPARGTMFLAPQRKNKEQSEREIEKRNDRGRGGEVDGDENHGRGATDAHLFSVPIKHFSSPVAP